MNASILAKMHEDEGHSVDRDVLDLFSILHDHKRENEGYDIDHGRRAAEALHFYRGRFFELPESAFSELYRACEFHSNGRTTDPSLNVRICWDADRLDLYRVGVTPDAKYLCTDIAKREQVIAKAVRRSIK